MIKVLIEEIEGGLINFDDPVNTIQFNKKGVAKLNGKKKGFTYFSKGYEDLYKTKLSIDFSGLRANTGLDKLIEELNQVDILSMSGFVDFETNSLYITYVAAHLFEQLIEFDIGD